MVNARWRRTVLWLGLAVVLGCSPGTSGSTPPSLPPSSPSPLLQQAAPQFVRPTLAGSKFDSKGHRGSVVVVKFFAEYCAPCKRTLPAAEALHQRYDDVVFVGISEDEFARQAQSMVSAYALTFPVVLDRGNVLAGRFRVAEMPSTFVIDAQGITRWVGGPGQTEAALQQAIEAVRATAVEPPQ
jgi:thiol-disulfide isomerase/thioredoxin